MTEESSPQAPVTEPLFEADSLPNGNNVHTVNAATELPLGIRVAGAWSWRLVLIAIAVAGLIWLIMVLRNVVIPLVIAILLTALLYPIVAFFERRGLPKGLGGSARAVRRPRVNSVIPTELPTSSAMLPTSL